MKISKQSRRDAKSLFRACLKDGVLEEGRVHQTVDSMLAEKPRGFAGILSHFSRLIRIYQAEHSAHVESAHALTAEHQEQFKSNLARKHGKGLTYTFEINPALLGGVRVKVGSTVYDSTIHGRLLALQESFKA